MNYKLGKIAIAVTSLLASALTTTHSVAADADCVGKVPQIRVITQPMLTVGHLDKLKGEFEQKWKTKVEMVQLGENERRSRARLDASTGGGAFQVYYIDEANVAEFASAKWVLPLMDPNLDRCKGKSAAGA